MIFSITTYNRNRIAIPSIRQLISMINSGDQLTIQDDGSSEFAMTAFFSKIDCPDAHPSIKVIRNIHKGIEQNNISRLDSLPESKRDAFVYLSDDDMQYSIDFYSTLLKLRDMMQAYPNIFAGTLFNVNGEKLGRHKMIQPKISFAYNNETYWVKESFGGCSVLIRVTDFLRAMKAYSSSEYKGPFGWDWAVCNYAIEHGRQLVATEKSYVQHIGKTGTNSRPHSYDSADNFAQ